MDNLTIRDDPAAPSVSRSTIIHNVEVPLALALRWGDPGRVPGTRELAIPRTPFIVPHRLGW